MNSFKGLWDELPEEHYVFVKEALALMSQMANVKIKTPNLATTSCFLQPLSWGPWAVVMT